LRRAALLASGAALTACVAVWVTQGDQTGRIRSYLVWHALAFTAYLVALPAARGLSRRGLAAALGLSVVWRVLLVMAPPLLSDDVYRTLWEGRIQLHGGNPYAWMDRPDAPRFAALRDEAVWTKVNHKSYTAIYPPLAQLVARGVATVADSVTAVKAAFVLFELATLVLLALLLARREEPLERVLVLAWSPLALVEIAGSGHNEPLGMALLVGSLLALEAKRPLASAVLAALGAQAKLLPGLVAAAWVRRYRAVHVAAGLAVGLVLVWPYRGAGSGLWRSLGNYAEYWRFNETVFALIRALLPTQAAAVTAALVLLAVLAAVLASQSVPPERAALFLVVGWLLVSPNVLPWYALWLCPLLVLHEAPAALLFTGTVSLAYLVYPAWRAGQPWHVGWDVRALEYGPCLALAVLSWRRARRRQGPALSKVMNPGIESPRGAC
jgi:glycosyl transferase family 87